LEGGPETWMASCGRRLVVWNSPPCGRGGFSFAPVRFEWLLNADTSERRVNAPLPMFGDVRGIVGIRPHLRRHAMSRRLCARRMSFSNTSPVAVFALPV
jgi:hypothetical protein